MDSDVHGSKRKERGKPTIDLIKYLVNSHAGLLNIQHSFMKIFRVIAVLCLGWCVCLCVCARMCVYVWKKNLCLCFEIAANEYVVHRKIKYVYRITASCERKTKRKLNVWQF